MRIPISLNDGALWPYTKLSNTNHGALQIALLVPTRKCREKTRGPPSYAKLHSVAIVDALAFNFSVTGGAEVMVSHLWELSSCKTTYQVRRVGGE